jgi:hypothetical protein
LCPLCDGPHIIFADTHQLRSNGNLIVETFGETFGRFKRLLDGRRVVTHAASAIFRFPSSRHSITDSFKNLAVL